MIASDPAGSRTAGNLWHFMTKGVLATRLQLAIGAGRSRSSSRAATAIWSDNSSQFWTDDEDWTVGAPVTGRRPELSVRPFQFRHERLNISSTIFPDTCPVETVA
jgi:hypothetical protein